MNRKRSLLFRIICKKTYRIYLGVSMTIVIGIAGVWLVSRHSAPMQSQGEMYDNIISSSLNWSAQHSMKEADRYRENGDEGTAMVLYMSVEEKLADNHSSTASEIKVRSCINRGDIYMAHGNYGDALEAYFKGLTISEESPDEPHIALIYKNMATVYGHFHDYDKSLSLELKGYEKARAFGDSAMMTMLLNNIARIYVGLEKPSEARRYFNMLINLNYGKSPQDIYKRDYTLAMVLRCEGKWHEAMKRFRDLAVRHADANDPQYICTAYDEMYWISNHIPERRDSAEYYLCECIRLAKENSLSLMFLNKFKELSDLYKKKGDIEEYIKWRMAYLDLVDSVYLENARKVYDARNQQFLYETTKAKTQINSLWQEKKNKDKVISRQRWTIFWILTGMLAATWLIWYIIRKNRKLKESYRNLYTLNKSLINNHTRAVSKQRELEDENERLRAETKRHTDGTMNDSELTTAPDNMGDTEGKEKYSSSNLSEEQTRMLTRRINDVMESDSHEYCNTEFSLNILAELVGSNIRYVSQVINHEFGKSFNNYVNEYRIREACKRLSGKDVYSNYSIKGIGESVGFRSHSTFVGVFRKITGMTPSIYRKMANP